MQSDCLKWFLGGEKGSDQNKKKHFVSTTLQVEEDSIKKPQPFKKKSQKLKKFKKKLKKTKSNPIKTKPKPEKKINIPPE